VYLEKWISYSLNNRWERLGATGGVLVEPSTVPASAFSLSGPLYACYSNTSTTASKEERLYQLHESVDFV